MTRILLFSRSIRSGKTTELFRNLHRFPNAGGFLCPDNELENRELFLIRKKKHLPFQVAEAIPDKTTAIGRFHFLLETFHMAREEMQHCVRDQLDWLIVDEVGKLEINQNKGLEPTLAEIISYYKNPNTHGNLLLVVRDYLVSEIINHYKIDNYKQLAELDSWKIEA